MRAPTWKVNKPAPWCCTRGEYARLNGFSLYVRVWEDGWTKAHVEYPGAPGFGPYTAAEFQWPPVEGKEAVTRAFAREWCERQARTLPKAKAEG